MKKIALIGSTGSIGTQTLQVVRMNDDIQVCAIAARDNIELLEDQIREFKPMIASVWEPELAKDLKQRVSDTSCRVLAGYDGLMEVATCYDSELLITGLVGMRGIEPTIAAIESGKDIAIANKETLVCAGHIIMPLAKEYGVKILPVDSEHSAIFQSLQGVGNNKIDRIILTASGGPFRGYTREELENVTLERALNHPTWNMGVKVTIDSSTLANKGLEVIEASRLFDVSVDKIDVVVHPQSILHSAVQFDDGAVIGQMGVTDMKQMIQYAIYYPDRYPLPGPRLDFSAIGRFDFEKPDTEVFPALTLAYEAGRIGGSMPTVFNSANEYAVDKFIEGKIHYTEIPEIIRSAMNKHKVIEDPSVSDIVQIRREIKHLILN